MNELEAIAQALAEELDPAIGETDAYREALRFLEANPDSQALFEREREFYRRQDGLLGAVHLSEIARARIAKNLHAAQNNNEATATRSNRATPWLALAAALALAALGFFALQLRDNAPTVVDNGTVLSAEQPATLAEFHDFSVAQVETNINLDLRSKKLDKIKAFLADAASPHEVSVPQAFAQLNTIGCQLFTWRGQNVSMVCFDQDDEILHVFAIPRTLVADLGESPTPGKLRNRELLSWADEHHAYVMVTHNTGVPLRNT